MSMDSLRLLFSIDEGYLEEWFEQHYKELGFQYVQFKRQRGNKAQFGDYFGIFKGHFVNIEIETYSGGFFSHKRYVRDRIQVIVCFLDRHFFLNKIWTKSEMEERKAKTIIECHNLIFPKSTTYQAKMSPQDKCIEYPICISFLQAVDLQRKSKHEKRNILQEVNEVIKSLERKKELNSLKPITQMK